MMKKFLCWVFFGWFSRKTRTQFSVKTIASNFSRRKMNEHTLHNRVCAADSGRAYTVSLSCADITAAVVYTRVKDKRKHTP